MLTHLRIQNFKSWRDTGAIRLAPITILFGKNSAGKSSITQFLMMLKQTVESPDRQRVLHLGDQRSLFDLGTYQDIVFRHDVNNDVTFSLGWRPVHTITIQDPLTETEFAGSELEFSATVKWIDERIQVDKFRYTLKDDARPLEVDFQRKEIKNKAAYELQASPYQLVRNQGRVWKLPYPVKFYGFPDEAIAYYQNSRFVLDLVLELEREFGRLNYLGPLREFPSREYSASGEIPANVGSRGDRAIEAILASQETQLSAGPGKRKRQFEKVIAEWLKRLGLIAEFSVRPTTSNKKKFEVLVKVSEDLPAVNLTDVGFGISQVLPVIIGCFYAQAWSTLILEQPEIHLHPQAQKSLADLLIETVQSRIDGKDRNVQLVVESHSEHLLQRLLRRIAEGKIAPEDVAVYVVSQGNSGSQIEELRVNLFGEVENWPDDFFGNELEDLVSRVEAASKTDAHESKDLAALENS